MIVHKDVHYQISFSGNPESEIAVVTFDPMFVFQGDKAAGFGRAFLEAAGLAVYCVSRTSECFYQMFDPAPVAADIERRGFGRVFTYGSSVGAHAALYFSKELDASAIAFSPRLPLHPTARDKYRAYDHVEMLHPVRFEERISSHQHLIAYDPFDETDQRFVDATLSHLPREQFVKAWFFGHPVIEPLVRIGLGKSIVLDFIRRGARPGPEFRRRKGESNRYLFNVSRMAERHGHASVALALIERAIGNGLDEPGVRLHLSKLLSKLGRKEEAVAALEGRELDVTERAALAKAYASLGRLDRALELVSRNLEMSSAAFLFRDQADFLQRSGRTSDALAAVERGLALHPGHRELTNRKQRWSA